MHRNLPGGDAKDIGIGWKGLQVRGGGVLPPFRWSGVSFYIFLAAALGGMEQRRLGVRCVVTDTRRRSTLSGVVVASAAVRPGKAVATVQL